MFNIHYLVSIFWLALVSISFAHAQNGLPENAGDIVKKWAIRFDFDDDSCYPAAAIFENGKSNKGLRAKGGKTNDCRDVSQLHNANTYARYIAVNEDSITYAFIMYALYFEKDQWACWTPFELPGGHTHDWEWAGVWLINGEPTHISCSAHGSKGKTLAINSPGTAAWLGTHPKIVYHQDGFSTHCMSFAETNHEPKNDLKQWLTPSILEWDRLTKGQQKLLAKDWGKANPPFINAFFFTAIETYKPLPFPGKMRWEQKGKP